MKELGYDLQIVEFTDYVQPNTAVEDGDLLANYFQHQPYLDDFNENNGTHIVSVAAIHYEPFGMYPGKTATLEDLQDGATIAIPNDGSNEARALYLLQDLGLITLKDGVGYTATVLDIADIPRNLNITEIEAAQLVLTLQDVDFAIINGNYALQGGLSVVDDAVAMESSDSDSAQTYANILAVKEGNENDPAVLALVSVLQSDEIADFIDETYQGSVVAMTR
jgi:D-methionine transport system substrate-binding protein